MIQMQCLSEMLSLVDKVQTLNGSFFDEISLGFGMKLNDRRRTNGI